MNVVDRAVELESCPDKTTLLNTLCVRIPGSIWPAKLHLMFTLTAFQAVGG